MSFILTGSWRLLRAHPIPGLSSRSGALLLGQVDNDLLLPFAVFISSTRIDPSATVTFLASATL